MFGWLPEVGLKILMNKTAQPTKKKKKLQPKTLRIKINKGKTVESMAEWKGSLKNLSHPSFIHLWGCGKYKNLKDLISAVKDFVHQECKIHINSYHTGKKIKIHKGGTKKVCSETEEIFYLGSYQMFLVKHTRF